MQQMWFTAALWLCLALVAVLAANWLRISTALSEIVVGTLAQVVIGALAGAGALNAKTEWITFLAGTGSIVLTFLAGAELDPVVFRAKWKESTAVGLAGFFFPFLGAAMVAHYLVGWPWRPSWLAGVALSTTSVAVVYAVMLELGFNRTIYGKAILAACFINDVGTGIALGLSRSGAWEQIAGGWLPVVHLAAGILGDPWMSLVALAILASVALAWVPAIWFGLLSAFSTLPMVMPTLPLRDSPDSSDSGPTTPRPKARTRNGGWLSSESPYLRLLG